MDNLRKGFPVLQQYTYLNTAACGLLPEKVWEFRQDHDMDFFLKASVIKQDMGEMLTGVRESIGSLFHCAPNRVALIPNFSYGFNSVLGAIDPGAKILLLREDYPSINWPVESREFKTCYAQIDEHLEDNIRDTIGKEKPDVFAFSIVQYTNGIQLSSAFIKSLKESFPDLIIIGDGTQYFGTTNFNFDSSGLDVAIASCYKWMNAGYGNGFMLFRSGVEAKLNPKHLGFGSLQGKYKEQEGNFIGKFEPGHLDTLNFGSLKVAIKIIENTGWETIEAQLSKLKNNAMERFSNAGLLDNWIAERKTFASIFNIKGDEHLLQDLRSHDIIASLRGNGVRISLHYFNTEEELEKLYKVLKI